VLGRTLATVGRMKTHISISNDRCDLSEANKFVGDIRFGAVTSFVGVTRQDTVHNAQVVALVFECHVPLALHVLSEIVENFRAAEPELGHVYIHHRIGYVPVGEGNVVLAVSCGHRKLAFLVIEGIMQELKARLPIWKKEHFDNGGSRWMENMEYTVG
jgi:molybdopterin synthase catalytic subunit